jgi:hypothetical protein
MRLLPEEGTMKRTLVAFSLVLSGCFSTMVWDKPGITESTFNKDSYECERDARQSGHFGGGLGGELNFRTFLKKCMVARGYTLQD